jgi:hypothetical protein
MHDGTLQEFAAHRIKIVTLPPHTMNTFQSSDLSFFGVLKKRMAYKFPMNSDDSITAFIRRIFHNMKQTLVADNARSAFVQIGVRYDIDVVPYRLIFDESTLRQSQGFLMLWHRDDLLEQLLARRRSAQLGWVNREMRNNWIE